MGTTPVKQDTLEITVTSIHQKKGDIVISFVPKIYKQFRYLILKSTNQTIECVTSDESKVSLL